MRRSILVLLTLLAAEKAARANAPAPFSRPTGVVPGVVVERASPVVVEREDLSVDCSAGVHPTCTFVATYHLLHPGTGEEELVGAFYLAERPSERGRSDARSNGVAIRLDGVDAHAEASAEQLGRMDAIVREDPSIASVVDDEGLELRREPFRIVLAGGRRAKLVFEGELRPTRFAGDRDRSYTFLPLEVRHPLLGPRSDAWGESTEDFLYLVSPITRWAGDPEVHIQIRHASGTDFVASSPASSFSSASAGGATTERAVLRASSRQNLAFRLTRTPSVFHHGGPVVGIGPRIGREELRVRLGYEVGLSRHLILGASTETNFDDYATTAVTLDAATSNVAWVIPSLAVGAGIPLQLRRDAVTRLGGRAQVGLFWPFVSVLLPLDVYPAASSSGSHVEASFLTQLSF